MKQPPIPLLPETECSSFPDSRGPGRLVALQAESDAPPQRLKRLNTAAVTSVPEHLCHRYQMIPLLLDEEIVVAMADPNDVLAVDDTRLITGLDVRPVRLPAGAIQRALETGDCSQLFDALVAQGQHELLERLYAAADTCGRRTWRERMDFSSIFPLQSLDVVARISGPLASVKVAQRFGNPSDAPIEAVYVFPLPAGAAVHAFRMRVGERVVESQLQERKQARQTYEAGKREGYRAALIEQDRDNVFTVSVGNLPPGEAVDIELEYAERLECNETETIFRFPLVVAPRYIPGVPLDRQSVGAGTASDTDVVADASRITPPLLLPELRQGARLRLAVHLEAAGRLPTRLACSQHAMSQQADQHDLLVELARTDELLDRDFLLRFRLAGAEPMALLLTGPKHFLLSVLPPLEEARGSKKKKRTTPRDVIFVLDRSGSMGGSKMDSARRAVLHFLDTMRDGDRFALMAFDDRVEIFGASEGAALPLHAVTQRANARQWLAAVNARGGTQIQEPMRRLLALPSSEGRVPCAVLITDGQVGNEAEIFRMVAQSDGALRIFTLGVDTAVNDAFLRRVAELGRGTCELVTPGEALEGALDRLSRETGEPLVVDLELIDRGLEPLQETLVPQRLPDLFAARAVHQSGMQRGGGGVEVRGRMGPHGRWNTTVTPTVSSNPALGILWARDHVKALEDRIRLNGSQREAVEKEIVALALEYGLLTRFTSFVLVDRSELVKKAAQTVVQPVSLPAEWAREGFTAFDGFGVCDMAVVEDTVKDLSSDSFTDLQYSGGVEEEISLDKLKELVDEAPIVRVVNLILSQAINDRATAVIVEPQARSGQVRYRVDGVLHEVMSPPLHIMAPMTTRLKMMAGADIAERRRPQAGSMQLRHEGRDFDLDLAFSPIVYGERIAIQLRDCAATPPQLETLGLTVEHLAALHTVLRRRDGLLLAVGAPHSGVSTTLRACLRHLHDGTRDLVACDATHRVSRDGITESVLPPGGVGADEFLAGLVRQQPDVILVAPLADAASARLLAEAAATRCLVLAGLVAENAAEGIARWTQLAGTTVLALVVEQRLVRLLCTKCKASGSVALTALGPLRPRQPLPDPITVARSVGCEACGSTGYRGVRPLYALWKMAKGGLVPWSDLLEEATRLVLSFETSVEECLRVLAVESVAAPS